MADKVQKPKKQKTKPKAGEPGVLGALPATRPQRIGTRRASAPKTFEQPQAAQAAASPKPGAGPKPAAQPRPVAKQKPAAAAAKPKPAAKPRAAKPKAAAPRTFEPTPAAETAAAAGATAAAPKPAREPRPRPVREGAPGIGTSAEREPEAIEHGRPSGTELVSTAVKAAGEVTQIGLTIGGKIIKRAVERLPKP